MEKTYTSLKKLVGQDFTIKKVNGYKWKKFDPATNKPIVSEKYEQGFSKKYEVETDKGTMDVSAGQLGNMLEGASKEGRSDLIGRTFNVKSNGKDGMEIRYYINPVYKPTPPVDSFEDPTDYSQIGPEDYPF